MYIALALVILSVGFGIYFAKKRNQFDIAHVLPIINEAIDDVLLIEANKNDSEIAITIITEKAKGLIDVSQLPQVEKDYWTEEKLTVVIQQLVLILQRYKKSA